MKKNIDRTKVRLTVLVAFIFTLIGVVIAVAVIAAFLALLFRIMGPRPVIGILMTMTVISLLFFLFSEALVVFLYSGKKASEDRYPRFHLAVMNIKKRRRMWLRMLFLPRLYVLDMSGPNACAFGCGLFYQRAIAITPEIYNLLDEDELEAVIGHEIAHIRCADVGLATFISILTGCVSRFRKK